MKLSSGFPYIHIKITSADSLDIAESFVKIFTRLLNRYKEENAKIEKLYLSYIPEFLNYQLVESSYKKSGKDILANKKLGDKAGVDLIGADADSYFDSKK